MAKKQGHAQKHPAAYRLPPTTKKHWLNEENTLYRAKKYDEAQLAFEKASQPGFRSQEKPRSILPNVLQTLFIPLSSPTQLPQSHDQ